METVNNSGRTRTVVAGAVVLATLLLMAFLVRQMVKITAPAPAGAERAAARAKDNAEIRAVGLDANKSWGYVDQGRGIVRLPVDQAMKLAIQGYEKPAAFKADLAARLEKATAAAPAPKNDYE